MDRKLQGLIAIFYSGLFLLSCIHTSMTEASMNQKKTSSYLENIFKVKRVMYVTTAGDTSKAACATYFMKAAENGKYWQNQLFIKSIGGKEALVAEGAIDPLSLSLNSSRTEFGFSRETVNDAPEAFVSAASQDSPQLKQITHLAEPHEAPLGQVEVVHWNSTDGRDIEGLLIKPSDYNPKKKYPLYVMVHGAPLAWVEGYLG